MVKADDSRETRSIKRDDVTVVLRSIGERTTEACEQLLTEQVPESHLHHVSDLSVPESVFRPYEIGVAEDRKWTLVVDADILPRREFIQTLVSAGEDAASSTFALEAHVKDKFYGGERVAGNTLYKTDLLERAIDVGQEARNEAGRPETSVIKLMSDEGYEKEPVPATVALHDFEQYYKDIHRTGHGYYNNHRHQIPIIRPYWERNAESDADFRVISATVERLQKRGRAKNANFSERFSSDEVEALLEECGLNEKDELDPESVSHDRIERMCTAPSPPEFARCQRLTKLRNSRLWRRLPLPVRGFVIVGSQIGALRALAWTSGWGLSTVGEWVQSLAEGETAVTV